MQQVRTARDAGFASLWFPDHYLIGPIQMPQPILLLTWLMREAEGMTLGPNIRILPLLAPTLVAEEAATLDLLSGGRYVLGVGLGYRPEEFTAFNVPLSLRRCQVDARFRGVQRQAVQRAVLVQHLLQVRRLEAGLLHQRIAARADRVLFMAAGLPMVVK